MRTLCEQYCDVLDYGLWGNRWHRIEAAFEGMTEADLAYAPVEGLGGGTGLEERYLPLEALIGHVAFYCDEAARSLGAPLAPEGLGPLEALEDASRRLSAAARTVTDDRLAEPTALGGPERELGIIWALVENGILHPTWHFGCAAEVLAWREARDAGHVVPAPPSAPSGVFLMRDEQPWAVPLPRDRKELLLQHADRAYRLSPWHSIRRTVDGATADELAWTPLPDGDSLGFHAFHTAECKVVYASQGFGDASVGWQDARALLGYGGEPLTEDTLLRYMDTAHDYYREKLAAADPALFDRDAATGQIGPHTGWQVVAAMAQHDAWHGSQVALLRDAYRALWEGAAGR